MSDTSKVPKDKDDLEETKRIMERLVKAPPDPKVGKDDKKPKKPAQPVENSK